MVHLLPARRYASAGTSYDPVSVSVCHKKTQGPRGGMRRIALSLRHFALSYSVKAVLLNLPPQSSVTTQLCG